MLFCFTKIEHFHILLDLRKNALGNFCTPARNQHFEITLARALSVNLGGLKWKI